MIECEHREKTALQIEGAPFFTTPKSKMTSEEKKALLVWDTIIEERTHLLPPRVLETDVPQVHRGPQRHRNIFKEGIMGAA